MNNYIKTELSISPYCEAAADVLSAMLAEVGYESFVPNEKGVTAYVPEGLYSAESVIAVVADFPLEGYHINFSSENIEGEDWNTEWEKNYFQPIVVDDECVIHSTFHTDVPKTRYDIVIDPKMAFGTGYHQTTCHMIRAILVTDLVGKKVLDMGCGTALLAILACKHGATSAVAIDIDEFAYENAKENIQLNGTPCVEVRLGDVDVLRADDSFDYIFANINRNILLADMQHYVACMHDGSELFISGFYVEDIDVLKDEAERLGLKYLSFAEDNRWAMMRFVK